VLEELIEVQVPIRLARPEDAMQIHLLIEQFADRDEMLHRSTEEVLQSLGDYSVAYSGDEVVGCCAVQVCTDDLAEIKGLAVAPSQQGKGLGRRLVEACEEQARLQGVPRVFCLTYVPEFFGKMGYHLVDKVSLPHKVWNECLFCNKYPICGEEAMVKRFDGGTDPLVAMHSVGADGRPVTLLRILGVTGHPIIRR
jgi:amino-acid N-acetyltransferase